MKQIAITLNEYIYLFAEWTYYGSMMLWEVWKSTAILLAGITYIIFILLSIFSIIYQIHKRLDTI